MLLFGVWTAHGVRTISAQWLAINNKNKTEWPSGMAADCRVSMFLEIRSRMPSTLSCIQTYGHFSALIKHLNPQHMHVLITLQDLRIARRMQTRTLTVHTHHPHADSVSGWRTEKCAINMYIQSQTLDIFWISNLGHKTQCGMSKTAPCSLPNKTAWNKKGSTSWIET